MTGLIDAHVHLSDDVFVENIAHVIARAREAGLSLLVNVATTRRELETSFAYADQFPDAGFCHVAGTPPQDAQNAIEEDYHYFAKAARAGRLSAIGEVGLDYCFADTPATQQRQHEVLKRYLSLALECSLPLVVHCRAAFSDFFSMIDRYYCHDERSRPGMLHCFTGTLEEAKELIARGWYVSIGGIVTFKNAQGLRAVVQELPLEHLLIETDAPFLAPEPLRGKRNEPAYIAHTVEAIARIKGIDVRDLRAIVHANVLAFLRG